MEATTRPERRSGEDRRRRQPLAIKNLVFFFGGQRKALRRAADRRRIVALDHYRPSLFFGIAIVLSLSLLDALLTLILVSRGARELNPVMAFYLSFGPHVFLFAKYGLTALAVILIVLLSETLTARYRFKADIFLHLFALCFGSVVIWQFYLMST